MYRGWTKIDYQDKHCITEQTDKGTEDDRGRNGRTNFTWKIKKQATRLIPLFEHDDDDKHSCRASERILLSWLKSYFSIIFCKDVL